MYEKNITIRKTSAYIQRSDKVVSWFCICGLCLDRCMTIYQSYIYLICYWWNITLKHFFPSCIAAKPAAPLNTQQHFIDVSHPSKAKNKTHHVITWYCNSFNWFLCFHEAPLCHIWRACGKTGLDQHREHKCVPHVLYLCHPKHLWNSIVFMFLHQG